MKFYNIKILFKNSFEQKSKILFFLFLLIITVVLDFFSLATLAPLISIILDNSIIESIYLDKRFDIILKYIKKEDFMNFLFFGATFLFFMRTLLLIFALSIKNRIITSVEEKLNHKIFSNFFTISDYKNKIPYKEKNKILQVDIQQSISYLSHFFSLITEILLVFSIILVVLFTSVKIALFSLLIFFLIFLLFRALDKFNFKKLGFDFNKIESKRNSVVIESLLGIKDIIIVKNQSFFINKFQQINILRANLKSKYLTYSQSIRYMLELITFTLILMLLLFFQSKSNLIPVLVTLGAATVKLIPSINKIIDSIQQIKYFNPSVVKVTNSLKEPIEKRLTKVEAYNSINFVNISLKYEKEYIIKNLNWNIELSKFLGLKGISGSGKTSLINLLFGFIKQNTGQILVDNTLLGNNKYIANIGYVPQKVNLVDGSFAENIAFGEDKIDYEKLKRIIIDCKLDDLINENNFNIKVNEYENKLSGGQIQRIGIARALYFEPVFLILDESLNSLDIETSNEILNSLLKINKKIGLLIISHDENDFMHCEKIFNIQNGQIIN